MLALIAGEKTRADVAFFRGALMMAVQDNRGTVSIHASAARFCPSDQSSRALAIRLSHRKRVSGVVLPATTSVQTAASALAARDAVFGSRGITSGYFGATVMRHKRPPVDICGSPVDADLGHGKKLPHTRFPTFLRPRLRLCLGVVGHAPVPAGSLAVRRGTGSRIPTRVSKWL